VNQFSKEAPKIELIGSDHIKDIYYNESKNFQNNKFNSQNISKQDIYSKHTESIHTDQ